MCDPINTTAVNGYMNQDSHTVSCCILGGFLYLKDVWIKDISEISMNVKQEVSLFVVVVSFCC